MDLKKFIVPVKLPNTDANLRRGNSEFNTTDLVFVDSEEEVEKISPLCEERVVSSTDYALVNGASQFRHDKTIKGKNASPYWLRSTLKDWPKIIKTITPDGEIITSIVDDAEMGICPSMHLNINAILSARDSYPDFFKIKPVKNSKGVVKYHTAEFGEYPKTKSDNSDYLEELFSSNSPTIIPTGKKYVGPVYIDATFDEHLEYEYHNQKFVRTKLYPSERDSFYEDGSEIIMPKDLSYVWIKVEPLIWVIRNWNEMPKEINPDGNGKAKYIDLRTEEVVIGGIPFYPEENDLYCTYWQNSSIRGMLNSINVCNIKTNGNEAVGAPNGGNFKGYGFLQEAFNIQSQQNLTSKNNQQGQEPNQYNPYNFVFDKLSNDDLLKMYVKSNASVFLHGPSGVGKSGRVKLLDSTATRITLRPQMNPEEIDGTLDRTTGKFIPPLWYMQLTEKCKAEPDKKHVLFIDELTNVKPTIQSLVYSIVLDRAGKDGLWPLPDNAVVIAAGNENAGNLAAYPLTNALYRRFSHIYYEVDKEDWLDWATSVNKLRQLEHIDNKNEQRAKIHPAIIAYVISRGEKVLNQDLDEENPKIVTDPRKWEIASNVLYTTKNPNALLPAIGKEFTTDFVNFVQTKHLSVEDVVNGNYNKQEIKEMSNSKKLSSLVELSNVSDKDLPIVRKFVVEVLGKELLGPYDTLLIRKKPERAEIIEKYSLKLMENKNHFIEF